MRRVFLLLVLLGLLLQCLADGAATLPSWWLPGAVALTLVPALVVLLETRGPRLTATLLVAWGVWLRVGATPLQLTALLAASLALSDQLRWQRASRGETTPAWLPGPLTALLALGVGLPGPGAWVLATLGGASGLLGGRLERSGNAGPRGALVSSLVLAGAGLTVALAGSRPLPPLGPLAALLQALDRIPGGLPGEALTTLGLALLLPGLLARLLPRVPGRVLLVTPLAPVRPYPGGHYPLDFFSSRSARGQGVWTSELECPYLGTHLLARNLDASCVSLEFPDEAAFREELSEVAYEVVGIGFTVVSRDTVRRMCEIVRQLRPQARIVLGGYGVVCLPGQHQGDLGFEGLVDEVCHGEGSAFLRRLLGEPEEHERDLRLPPQRFFPFGLRFLEQRFLPVVASFGCANRCDFCGTSAFFEGQNVRFASPEALAEALVRAFAEDPALEMVALMDEDFLADPERIRTLSRLLWEREDFDYGRLQLSVFSTAASLAQYPPAELAALGVAYVWIGVESKFTPLKKRRRGDLGDLLRDLEEHGIATTVSWVLGFDFQEPSNLQEDVDWLVSLPSVTAQISLLGPLPGTALYRRLEAAGRLLDRPWEDAHLYQECMRYENFRPGELGEWVDRVYDALYRRRGPSMLRTAEVWLEGYLSHRDQEDPRLRDQAARSAVRLRELSPTLVAMARLAEEPSHRARAHRCLGRMEGAGLAPGAGEQLAGLLLEGLLRAHQVLLRRFGLPSRQPRTERVTYS